MINYQTINPTLLEASLTFPYQEPHKVFQNLYKTYKYKFLLESKDISPIYGRLSLAGIDPVLKITGKKDTFCIEGLNERGSVYLSEFTDNDFKICNKIEISEEKIKGIIKNQSDIIEETERSKRKNIAQVIRIILKKFAIGHKSFLGIYGAFSYDFIRLFEDIGSNNPENDTNDFTLFLYDTFIFFDHLKQTNEIIVYRKNTQEAEKDINATAKKITKNRNNKISYDIINAKFELDEKKYKNLIKLAKKYATDGELFEVVFSNILKAEFKGDPFGLYLKYRDVNPSPYLFYFDFGKEQLVGASPEMMVRCENNIVNLRPIIEKMNLDLIVISPGPSIPKNAGNLMKIIDQYHFKYPIFGVCLGHEALIEYFGGTLKFIKPVHGKSSKIHHDSKGIFQNVTQDFDAGRYHSLVANKIADCFEQSATSEDLVMAVRHKKLPIDGVQFHPESVLTMKGENGFKIIKNLIS